MRCITAIWPAGPPKLSAATLAQTRTASGNEIPCPDLFDRSAAAVFAMTPFAISAPAVSSPSCARKGDVLFPAVFHANRMFAVAGLLRMSLPADFPLHRAGLAIDRLRGPRPTVGD